MGARHACYDEKGEISAERTEALTKHLISKGVKGVYVGGSSGECIYQSVADRKKTLEHVMKAAEGGIGGTYGVMPELFLKMMALVKEGNLARAGEIQYEVNSIISGMCSCHGNLYAVMKEILKIREGLELGGVRKPLPALTEEDMPQVKACAEMITAAVEKYV